MANAGRYQKPNEKGDVRSEIALPLQGLLMKGRFQKELCVKAIKIGVNRVIE